MNQPIDRQNFRFAVTSEVSAELSIKFGLVSDECKIRPKEGALCEAGFAAKNPPKDTGMDNYKICVKTTSEKNHPPTDSSSTR
ncbi:MAG TPA: hypothetical protein VIG33_06015 [Pseudobdellovibrionaceae bacterium]|jgi:hypothetical protein